MEGVISSDENNQNHQQQFNEGILRVGSTRRQRSRSFNSSFDANQNKESCDRPSVKFDLSCDYPESGDGKLRRNSGDFSSNIMKKLPLSPRTSGSNDNEVDKVEIFGGESGGGNDEDDDDYSASVSTMMQRKPSSRRSSRRKKRGSTPFLIEEGMDSLSAISRRRSSVFTTSSGDTAISMDETMDDDAEISIQEQQIFEKLRLHKEVLAAAKHQPWPLRKKVKLVKQAKSYIRRHEGALQERLAQRRSTKDVLAQVSIYFANKWKYFRREIVNLQIWVIPWEVRIKEIESHFGSAVASYFVFLRWLFWINLVIAIVLVAFIVTPEILLTKDNKLAGDRKILLPNEVSKSKNFLTIWEFEGIVKHSPFFYGWYDNWSETNKTGYRLSLAYFVVMLIVYAYSFVAILRKMAENSRMSKLSEKEDECAFSWKLLTGWDFMIGNPETAHNKIASIVLGFKESLLEEAEKEKKLGQWKIQLVRLFVNLTVILLLAFSVWAVVKIVNNSSDEMENQGNWWKQNEITIVMSLISFIFPIFFEILGLLENYHPRKTLRLQLGRIMILNLLNLYSLIFALFGKIHDMEEELQALKPKISQSNLFLMNNFNSSHCRSVWILCSELSSKKNSFNQNLTTLSSSTTSAASLKSKTFMTTLAALTLITTLSPKSQENYFDPGRLSDAPSELRMGLDSFNDYENLEALNYFNNYSESTPVVERRTPSVPLFDDRIKWEGYSEKDDPSVNYDNYDLGNITGSEESSNWTTTLIDDNYTSEFDSTESWTSGESTEATTNNYAEFLTTEKTESVVENQVKTTENPLVKKGKKNNTKCPVTICDVCHDSSAKKYSRAVSLSAIKRLNMSTKKKLRRLCWETMFGQELAKLTVMDLMLTIFATLGMDFFRALFVRYTNSWWCWDLEKQFPQYGDFKIAENILHLVNNQGMVWMGMFFSPGLTLLNVVKLGILMYLRAWAVLTCNVPHEVIFRASRSNNFYLALLLTMLFLCVIPVGYALTWIEPSWHCGPFSGYQRIYHIATESLKDALPDQVRRSLDYIASPGIIIPLIVLMALIIYYMISLTGSLREANNDLKIQLRHERTEERRKMFKIASKRGQAIDTPFSRWKKILSPSATSPKPSAIQITKAVGSILQERRQRAFERLHSTSEEVPNGDPTLILQIPEPSSLSPINIDGEQIFFGNDQQLPQNSHTDKTTGTNIPKICIDGVEPEVADSPQVLETLENEMKEEKNVTHE